MCGIFGTFACEGASVSEQDTSSLIKSLFINSESRGSEASGLLSALGSQCQVLKKPVPATKLIRSREYSKLLKTTFADRERDGNRGSICFVGHSRLVTNGHQINDENNQPVTAKNMVAVHNGIIVNAPQIWDRHKDIQRKTELDSEVIVALAQKFAGKHPFECIFSKIYSEIEGAASIALFDSKSQSIALATNTGSLYYSHSKDGSLWAFASEEGILRKVLKSGTVLGEPSKGIIQLKPGHAIVVGLGDGRRTDLSFKLWRPEKPGRVTERLASVIERVEAKLVNTHFRSLPAGSLSAASLVDPPVRRCSKCILPETMPYIDFDDEGVCSFCRKYRKTKLKGENAFEETLACHRSNDGSPDCILAFSGGRDSAYALHLLREKYNMTPLAMTYDWGMVTDLGRRNQARMCGALGVEQILISANIDQKRAYIAKNIKAWLKTPELGLVPLFMAGDKAFFYHANRVSKEAGTSLIIFCLNPLEQTEFKTGFAGIRKMDNAGYYSGSIFSKLGVASYYLSCFLKNPDFLNSSLLDSAFAYGMTYFLPKNYLSFYEYYPWDEDEINRLLIDEYDWEIDEDTPTTWRIGDGTAAFYNYIYLKVAGLSENDTFRSNQVREGVITRAEALKKSQRENIPRWGSIEEYLKLLGLDFFDTIAKINSIRPIYADASRRRIRKSYAPATSNGKLTSDN